MVEYKDRLLTAMKQAPALAAVPERSRIQRLADVLELSYQGVKKVLDGKSKTFSALNNARIAAFLDVDASWLATGQGMMAPRVGRAVAEGVMAKVHMTEHGAPAGRQTGAQWKYPPPSPSELLEVREATPEHLYPLRQGTSRPAPEKLNDVFEDWRLHASPLSLEVIEGLSLLAQKNALREEDWQVIKALMLRFGKP